MTFPSDDEGEPSEEEESDAEEEEEESDEDEEEENKDKETEKVENVSAYDVLHQLNANLAQLSANEITPV